MINPVIEEDLQYILSSKLPWESFFGKTIVISGASGLLPSYLVETLLYLNSKKLGPPVKIVGIVRNKEKARKRFRCYESRDDLILLNQDVCNPIIYNEPIHFVVHAASQASPKYYGIDPVGTLNANLIGTMRLLEIAKNNPVESFLLFSSGEVYGQLPDFKLRIGEKDYGYLDPTDIRSCYAESKRMAENMCNCWSYQFGIPVKIVRPFHTYGPLMREDDGRVFADFVFDILNSRDITLKSDGSAKRVFCYISDATIGFFLVLLKGEIRQAYNVAGEEEISILELANILVNMFPEKHLKVKFIPRNNDNKYLESPIKFQSPDVSKINNIGWKKNYSIKEGFYRTVRSYLG